MKDRPKSAVLTRRRFVSLIAAGSAAFVAAPLAAATPPAARKRPAAATAMPEPVRKEFERQRKSTLETLTVIRKHRMAPGTEMASVFIPLKSSRGNG